MGLFVNGVFSPKRRHPTRATLLRCDVIWTLQKKPADKKKTPKLHRYDSTGCLVWVCVQCEMETSCTLPETNSSPLKNQWLEDEDPFGRICFQGRTVSFRECRFFSKFILRMMFEHWHRWTWIDFEVYHKLSIMPPGFVSGKSLDLISIILDYH